jgi:xanthine dehydrogenase YagT iron-sulfur-binding subunit
MIDEFDDNLHPELQAELSADERELLSLVPELTDLGAERRKFLGQAAAGGLGIFALQLLAQEQVLAKLASAEGAVFAPIVEENAVAVKLKINGVEKTSESRFARQPARRLREKLALTGTKKGCDQGQCGAVHRHCQQSPRIIVSDFDGDCEGKK